MQNSVVIFIFYFLGWKYPFWVKMVQNFKIVSLSGNIVARLFQIVKFDGNIHFFSVVDPFLQVLFKKSIGHFDVT